MKVSSTLCFLLAILVCASTKKSDCCEERKTNHLEEKNYCDQMQNYCEKEDQNNCSQNQSEKIKCDSEKCIPCDNEPKVMCYFTNWAWYRKDQGKFLPNNIDPSLCTHVIYGFATLDNETYTIQSYDSWADLDNGFYSMVTALKEFGVKVILALGGWNDSVGDKYSILVNNKTLRRNFIKHSIVFLLKHNFVGLEVNWEYPHCWQANCSAGPESDVTKFGLFVKELSLAYRHVGLTLSAAVAAGEKFVDNSYDVPTLSCYLDWINVINYNYYTAKNGLVLPNSPIYAEQNDSVIFSLNHWESKGACKCKLNIGIASYGHTFNLKNSADHFFGDVVSGPGIPGNVTHIEGVLSYHEICLLIKNSGWIVENSWANGAVAYKDDQLVSFTNIYDIEVRTGLVKMNSYGGVFLWTLDYDDFNNVCGCGAYPILTAINRELRGLKIRRVLCY